MICGLPCSGKTTLARKLEAELSAPALCFSPDEWLVPFVGARNWDTDEKTYNHQRLKIKAMLLDFAFRTVKQGVHAILDNGFWSKEERNVYRAKAAEHGINIKLHYLDVPHEELLARLRRRNDNLPSGCFYIPESRLIEWFGVFQPPEANELFL